MNRKASPKKIAFLFLNRKKGWVDPLLEETPFFGKLQWRRGHWEGKFIFQGKLIDLEIDPNSKDKEKLFLPPLIQGVKKLSKNLPKALAQALLKEQKLLSDWKPSQSLEEIVISLRKGVESLQLNEDGSGMLALDAMPIFPYEGHFLDLEFNAKGQYVAHSING